MTCLSPRRTLATLLTLMALVGTASAGSGAGSRGGTPPLRLAQQDPGDDQGGDPAGLVLRINRLEEQVRSLTGQIEQLQYQNRQLADKVTKTQADFDFRLQDLEHGGGAAGRPAGAAPPQRRSDAVPSTPADASLAAAAPPPAATPAVPARSANGDAFDPAANPNAPGAPRPLGLTPPSAPLAGRAARASAQADETHAPLDLMHVPAATEPTSPSADTPSIIAAPAAAPRDPGVASLVPGGTRGEYDTDLGLYKQGQYDGAAAGFTAFADKYPKDRMVPDAIYLAGESYAKLGRHREAAEQFLKLSTDFGKAPRAPDALLKLGMSLNALGAKEQACATYQEVTRRYPTASPDVRAAVDRELKRARCTSNG